MSKLLIIIIFTLLYLLLSTIIYIKWNDYKIDVEGFLIGDVIINIICFPISISVFTILGLIKLFNYRIK